VYTGTFNAQVFISKLKVFMRNRTRAVFLVLDGHAAHRANIVAAHVQSLKGRLELHFLAGHAPDLNPDEFVWNHLRQNGVTKH
jgi:transposase